MDLSLKALVRKFVPSCFGDGEFKPAINARGDLCVAQSLPPKAELVRLGNTYTCAIATGSAFTYVAAWPTTRAELVLYNGESASGKTYVIDSAWMTSISSTAAAASLSLLAQYAPAIAAPTDDTAQLITSRSGKTAYPGSAKRAVAVTTMTANKWELVGHTPAGPSASIATSVYADLYGGWLLKPGATLGLAGVAGTAAGTAVLGVCWHEVQLDSVGS